jgi:hypothetical protein
VADITARFRLDVSGIDAALARVAAATLSVQGAFAAANAALAPFQSAFSAIKGSLDLGGELSDVSAQTGIAVGDLVVLRQAFSNAGMDAQAVGPAINRLQKALAGVNEDGEPANQAINSLGLSMSKLQAMSPANQFAAVSQALASISDPTQRATTAMGIFGRKGGEMMALFRDSSAMNVARQQVGGLAQTMDQNAVQFDSISDALGSANLKGQQLAAGFVSSIAPALEQVAAGLNSTDLTSLGETMGAITSSAIALGQSLSGMIPQIIGISTAIALFRSGFDAKVISSIAGIGPASTSAFAQVRAALASMNFSSMAGMAQTAFASVGAAARTAGIAIKGALISTGIGLLVTAITTGIEYVMGKFNQAQEAVRRIDSASRETTKTVRGLQAEFSKISSAADKVEFGKNIDQEIAGAQEKLSAVNSNESLSPAQRDDVAVNYRIEIQLLERMKAGMAKITPEVMAQRQAEKDRAAALDESRQKAAGLNAELGKNKQALDKKITDSQFADLSPTQQRDATVAGVGATDSAAIEDELNLLAAKRESSYLTDQEILRMQALIDARSQLVDIERSIVREREQAAKKAQEDADRRMEFIGESQNEIAINQAAASGDTDRAASLKRDMAIQQETMRGAEAGVPEEDARVLAAQKIAAQEALAAAQKDESNRRTLQAIDLELRLAEAKAAGNTEEAARIEWLKTYTAELERLKGIVPDGEAQSKASRLANAQSTQNPVDNSKAREALNLELQLVTAKAEGNKEEAARLEWLQRYNSELERAKQAGMDNTEAQNFAAKMADSQNSGESGRAETGALFASSMARIGAGGNFVSGGGDMMLNESRRQTSLLEKIARGVNRTPSDRGNGGYVLG